MTDLRFWLGLNRVRQIGPVRVRLLLDHFGDLERAWHASPTALHAAGLPQDALENLLYARQRLDLDRELARLQASGAQALTWESPDYPPPLREIEQAPPVLFVRGELTPADAFAVAIVGTRSPTSYGKEAARALAGDLARHGVTVVSGLALGIDGIAHRAALEAGGRTLAVLGNGIDVVYPTAHRHLAEEIVRAGALLSDFPLGTRPEAGNFPARNRLISGLALGTVVVEAGLRSGALITHRFALEQGRETFAVPGTIHSRASEGTNRLIREGEAKLVSGVQDILDELRLTMVPEQVETRTLAPETDAERSLLAHVSREPVHIDELVRCSGLDAATVSSTLCLMELKGMVRRVDNTSYVLAH